MGGEAKRRREAIARGEPDPGRKGYKNPGRRAHQMAELLRSTARKTKTAIAAAPPPPTPPAPVQRLKRGGRKAAAEPVGKSETNE